MMETFNFRGFDIPVHLANLTGGGPANFGEISDFHIKELQEHITIRPGDHVLELGCGIGRDAIPLTTILDRTGSYVGVDVVRDSIEWCARNITPKYPNFTFVYHDIRNTLYNPQGTMGIADVRLPREDGSVDAIFLESVFTHLLEPDIDHYLKEFRRILKPGGRILATMFLLNRSVLDHIQADTGGWLSFRHPYPNECYVDSLEEPLRSVGYMEEKALAMVDKAGLELAHPFIWGMWSGARQEHKSGQDVLILKPKA